MPVSAVGNPPPEADQLRNELETQLPEIIAQFNQVLQEQFGFKDIRVGGFTIVPAAAIADSNISCDEEGCSIS